MSQLGQCEDVKFEHLMEAFPGSSHEITKQTNSGIVN